ncbi:UDP-N-acetylmuramoyl-L-alanyl-D-glutamate--2,6-diaminopimelate ligase [Actinomyces capricornis]|uniref:UDP-N-acetylmuramyl-tripeptide synthetase n=1 Tax=Actinomyces capricornis TaxID=2755559 RepID=A0ABN6K4J2_9ACTO|nr:UDP-N-acetylmuramoyl-L-alanyl-D-glutamate--2,6-diaminopimelate ligase [Actinomyces capricornis]BDA63281.1 UDP-N-acetylmuramoyl-L-alanyl-D-glutamate--2,6-diaminopimelate ligase [Actinomyces capricornis]
MTNQAYQSAAALRPQHNAPVALSTLAAAHSLTPHPSAQGAALEDLAVTGVSMDSGDVAPGEIFVALPGFTVHGARYAAQAVEAGAVAVVTDAEGASIVASTCPGVAVLTCPDPRQVAGPLAAEVYHHPSRRLITTAVTGTNGKTTTSYFLDAIMRAHTGATMVAGTVELRVGATSVESPRTTVEAPVLQRLLAMAVEEGVGAACLEASSHAIVLHRLDATEIDVAGFTNLQRDHLDFHHTMEEYLEAKAQLFTPAHARRGVVCVDDQWGRRLAETSAIPVETLRAYPGSTPADWWVDDAEVSLEAAATTFTLHGPDGEELAASCPLPGLVNVQNAALALVMAIRAGVPADTAVTALAGAHNIPGRMQRINNRENGRGLCIVDFAHTPDAMELALQAVRPITPGRLIVVFGSDGDRDQGKRPMLGQVCARLADVLVVTDENPRSEDPQLIRDAILEGVRQVRPTMEDVEEITTWRGDAVRRGVELCGPQDTVIVTGKGHEPFLEAAGEFIRYNDAPVMAQAVEAKWGRA